MSPQIYRQDPDGSIRQVNPDSSLSALDISSTSSTNNMMASMMNTSVFYQLPASATLYHSQYEVKAGRWPASYNECVAVLGADGSITDYALYALGLRDNAELDKQIEDLDLSVRSYNCLTRASIHSVRQLDEFSENDLRNIRIFGGKSSEDVKYKLESMGLSLKA